HAGNHLDEAFIPRGVDEGLMEGAAEADPGIGILLARRRIRLLPKEFCFEAVQRIGLDMIAGKPRGERLQSLAELIDLAQGFRRVGGDEGPLALDDPNQAFALEAENGLAYRGAADAQTFRDRALDQRLTAPNLPPEDHQLQRFVRFC